MEFVAESLSLSEEDECDIFFIETEFCFDFYLEMKSKQIFFPKNSVSMYHKIYNNYNGGNDNGYSRNQKNGN